MIRYFPAMQADGIRFIAEIREGKLVIEPDLMKTVCINLLDNARKAIDGAGGQIVLSGKRVKGGYEIGVKDNGCGIPAEELAKISEAFYMVNKARSRGLRRRPDWGLPCVRPLWRFITGRCFMRVLRGKEPVSGYF